MKQEDRIRMLVNGQHITGADYNYPDGRLDLPFEARGFIRYMQEIGDLEVLFFVLKELSRQIVYAWERRVVNLNWEEDE